MTEKLIRLVWSLYPARFRHRFGAELHRDLRLPRSSTGASTAWQLVDALRVLPRLWWLELSRRIPAVSIGTDIRLALRALQRSPGYSFLVVGILALAIGGNAGVFSVAHAVLLRGLPYAAADRVVAVDPAPLRLTTGGWIVDESFADLAQVEAAALYVDGGGANLAGDGRSSRVTLAQVTGDFFRVLGVDALVGTTRPRDAREVVLSHAFWVQAFAGDPDVVGAEIDLNERAYRVVGVVPAGVAFPSAVDLWVPFPTESEFYSSAFGPSGIALLAPDADSRALRSILQDRLAAEYADVDASPRRVEFTSLRDELTGSVRTPLLLLLGIAATLVLLGCFNLAGLVLSRTSTRSGELSVRRALGASRLLLFRQVFVEVLVLAALGGVASIATASVATGLLRRVLPGATPGIETAGMTAPVLVFTALLTVAAALLVGLLPAAQGALIRTRCDTGRSSTDDRRSRRAQAAMVVGQVALAFILVVGAAWLGRTLRNLQSVPVGYDLERVVTFRVQLGSRYSDEAISAFIRDVDAALEADASVSTVGVTTYLPQQPAMASLLRIRPPDAQEDMYAVWVQADDDYFQALGIAVHQGTPFAEAGIDPNGFDRLVVSESMADALFPGSDAAGRAVAMRLSSEWIDARIDAVVADIYLRDLRGDPRGPRRNIVFTRMEANPSSALGFAVRVSGDPIAVAGRVREVVAGVDPRVAVFDVETTGEAVAQRIAVESAVARLALAFSISALVLAALGLYGLVSQGLVRRRRELGIRLALGAHPQGLVREAMAGPLRLTIVGLIGGAAGAAAVSRWISSLLFGVSPSDPLVAAAATSVVLAVASAAAWLSARGAMRVDPVESLRSE